MYLPIYKLSKNTFENATSFYFTAFFDNNNCISASKAIFVQPLTEATTIELST